MTASEFADFVLRHLDLDTWLTESTLQRRLAGIHGQAFTAARLLQALVAAGWVSAHPMHPNTYVLSSVCWLSEKPKPNPAP